MFTKLGSLLVPQHMIEAQEPPSEFVRKLQRIFGPDMHVEWNRIKQRWVIETCAKHHGSDQPNEHGVVVHDHLCQRVYAWMVRDEETDEYMPLCDRVIEKLHEKETYRQFGVGEAALNRFRQASKDFDDEQQRKHREQANDIMRHNRKFNRTTINKFVDLFKRHDLRPNK